MRNVFLFLAAAAAVSACDQANDHGEQTPVAATPAAMTYDGAEEQDPAAVIAHGERMSRMLGCKGCHGDNFQGKNVTEGDPDWGDMWAPNLALLIPEYTDAELDRAIRHGVPKDGREMWFMPSEAFAPVSDADLSALVAYLRTVPKGGEPVPPLNRGPIFEKLVAAGELKPAPGMVAKFEAAQPADLGPEHALGRYIARTTCVECHNNQLQGIPDFSPDLVAMAGVYSPEELKQMLATGEGKVKKDLGLMSISAQHRFAKLTPREMDAIVGYVKALGASQR